MDDTDLQQLIVEQFPTLDNMLYANHAAISPWPRATAKAVRAYASELCESGPLGVGRWLADETRLRNLVARMINGSSGDDIALLKNTTDGICAVANGIDWQPGDNVVAVRGEFISNQLPWDALAERGVEVRRVDIAACDQPEEALLGAMDQRTRVLTVSAVQWDSGLRLDLQKLGRECRARPALFFVDAIQQLGSLSIDVQACGIDALSAGSHKWQLAPEGIAVFYCSEQARQTLRLTSHGWRMLDEPFRFGQPGRAVSDTARRFETGSQSSMGQAALLASLSLLEKVGFERIDHLVLGNSRRLSEGIASLDGCELFSNSAPGRLSGIVALKPATMTAEKLCRELSKSRCFVAVRGPAVRISMHFYQHGEPVDRMLELLRQTLRKG